MIEANKIKLEYIGDVPEVFVNIVVTTNSEKIEVVLKDNHEHIEQIKVNGELVFEDRIEDEDKKVCNILNGLTFKEIRRISEMIPIEQLEFIKAGIQMNKKSSRRGFKLG